jgi:hypothetical protein
MPDHRQRRVRLSGFSSDNNIGEIVYRIVICISSSEADVMYGVS